MDPVYNEVIEIALDLQQVQKDTQALADQYSTSFGNIKKAWKEVLTSQQYEVKQSLKMEAEAAKIRATMFKDEKNEEKRIYAEGLRAYEALEDSAQKRRIGREEAVHRQIMALRQQEAEAAVAASSAAVGGTGGLTIGRGLRIGAGIAGTFGNFQLASAAYAGERIAQVFGVANTAISGTALTATIAGAALVGMGAAAAGLAKYGNEFNNTLANMSTLMHDGAMGSKQFASALNDVTVNAYLLSTKFNRDIVEVLKGFKEALSSGIETADLAKFTDTVGTLSASLGINFQASANILTTFKDSYKMSVDEMSEASAILFNLVDVGKVNIDELIGSFGRVAPIASAAGVSLKDTATMVATLTRQGFSASQAVTSTARLIEAVVNPSEKARKKFQELGIAFGQSALQGREFSDFLEELKDKTGGNLDVLAQLFPEERALRGVAAATKNLELFKQAAATIGQMGTDVEAAAKAMDTFSQNAGKTWEKLSGIAKLVGSGILNELNHAFYHNADGTVAKTDSSGALKYGLALSAFAQEVTAVFTTGVRNYVHDGASRFAAIEQDMFDKLNAVDHARAEAMQKKRFDVSKVDVWEKEVGGIENAKNATKELVAEQDKLNAKRAEERETDDEKMQVADAEAKVLALELEISQRREGIAKGSNDIAGDQMALAKGAGFQKMLSKLPLEEAEKVFDAKKKEIDEMVKKYQKFETGVQIAPLEYEIQNLKDRIDFIQTGASARPQTNSQLKQDLEAIETYRKKMADEKLKYDEETVKQDEAVEKRGLQIYEKDAREYEKYLKEKESLHDKFSKKSLQIETQLQASLDRLHGLRNSNALSSTTDPDRRHRIAQQQEQAAREGLESFAANGGTGKQLEDLQRAFEDAAGAVRDSARDVARGARQYDTDLGSVEDLYKQAEAKQLQDNQSAEMLAARGIKSVARPSIGAATQQAIQETQNKVTERREIEATIHVRTDTNLSPEAERTLNEWVQNAIAKDLATQTSQYYTPPTQVSNTRQVGEDNNQDYNDDE